MPAVSPSRWVTSITWNCVPHLDEKAKAEMLASYPPHMRDARSEGIPQLGVGAIYPIALDSVTCDPFRIPDFWPRGYALDVGWNVTACLWGARDPDADVIYIYSEYYGQQEKPAVHAAAIKARGEWIAGCIDPAARGRSQRDGERLIDDYELAGLNVRPALNAVEAGIYEVFSRLSTGRLKFFSTLAHLPREYKKYHRDEHGKVVKKDDHVLDCLVGDTLVRTSDGLRRIDELVGTTGKIQTIGGGYADYHSCERYGIARPVVRLDFEDGQQVRATPDHLFLTPDGWVQAKDMNGKLCVMATKGHLCSQKSFRTPSKSIADVATTSAASIFSATASAFTDVSRWISSGRSPETATSIMSMETSPTTTRTISKSNRSSIICRTTSEATAKAYLKRLWLLLLCGMAPALAVSGTRSTTMTSSTYSMPRRKRPARNVGLSMRGMLARMPGFAATSARRAQGIFRASMMRTGRALNAELGSASTNTSRKPHVADHVAARCLLVRDWGVADVYCLTVPSTSAFAVEDGLIVHNCVRYIAINWQDIFSVLPSRTDTFAAHRPADRLTGY